MKNLSKLTLVAAAGLFAAACSSKGGHGPARPGTPEDFKQNVADRVHFAFNKSNVTKEERTKLEQQASWLKTYGTATVIVEGHADKRGTREYNLALGERRANNVKNSLGSLGVAANRMRTISFGKDCLQVEGDTEEAHAQNRVGITVVDEDSCVVAK